MAQTKLNNTQVAGLADSWIPSANYWIYSSADAPTFVISIAADMTGIIGAGMRIKLTQTTAKYFIVTAVGAYSDGVTLVTVYGGTDYTLANAAIVSPYYSFVKCPLAFPISPDKWSVTVTDTSERSKTNPAQNTVYYSDLGSINISIPIGVWYTSLTVFAWATSNAAQTLTGIKVSLSTNNAAMDTSMMAGAGFAGAAGALSIGAIGLTMSKLITLTSKTSHYVVAQTNYANMNYIYLYNNAIPLVIKARCAYL